MSNRVSVTRLPPPPPAPSTRAEPAPTQSSDEGLLGWLEARVKRGVDALVGVVEHAAWQIEEDLGARLSHQPNAERIYVQQGLWAKKVSGGRSAGVDLKGAEARLDGVLGAIPVALAKNDGLARAEGFDAAGGTLRLSEGARTAVGRLEAPFDAMFASTVDALGALGSGALSPSGYMVQVMSDAARISDAWAHSKHLPASARNEAFARLVHFAFCDHRNGDSGTGLGSLDLKREAVGFGISDAGSLLEDAYAMTVARDFSGSGSDASHPVVFGNGVKGGFDRRIADRESGTSTVTHHFGEFLGVGFMNLLDDANAMVTRVDSPEVNPGDVRNGDFAVMLGKGLAAGALSPDQAVALTRWAYCPSADAAPALWGSPTGKGDDGRFLKPEDYRLETWIEAFRSTPHRSQAPLSLG